MTQATMVPRHQNPFTSSVCGLSPSYKPLNSTKYHQLVVLLPSDPLPYFPHFDLVLDGFGELNTVQITGKEQINWTEVEEISEIVPSLLLFMMFVELFYGVFGSFCVQFARILWFSTTGKLDYLKFYDSVSMWFQNVPVTVIINHFGKVFELISRLKNETLSFQTFYIVLDDVIHLNLHGFFLKFLNQTWLDGELKKMISIVLMMLFWWIKLHKHIFRQSALIKERVDKWAARPEDLDTALINCSDSSKNCSFSQTTRCYQTFYTRAGSRIRRIQLEDVVVETLATGRFLPQFQGKQVIGQLHFLEEYYGKRESFEETNRMKLAGRTD